MLNTITPWVTVHSHRLLRVMDFIICGYKLASPFLTGKTNKEIEEALSQFREKATQGQAKSGELLVDLEKRYQQDKEKLTARLKGADTSTMSTEEKLTEYGLITREQLRAREEAKFESAALSVGIAERLKLQLQRCGKLMVIFS